MTILADENIPRADEAFAEFGRVRLMPGRSITRAELADTDILIVRSITKVNRELLEGTPVRFVGTATNGLDHIDLEYLHSAGIAFADAAGANADAVVQYVVTALLELHDHGIGNIMGEKIGIIGVGRIGGRVVKCVRALGMEAVEYDLPRAVCEPGFKSARLEELYDCAVITFHVPLHDEGHHGTYHMADLEFLQRLRPGTILINTSRGGVVSSDALVHVLGTGHLGGAVLDVWEQEPSIPQALINACTIATPHIAAYSHDAKLRGTRVMADAVAALLGITSHWDMTPYLPNEKNPIIIPSDSSPLRAARTAALHVWDIRRDDAALRALLPLDDASRRTGFDDLRKNYPFRREFPAFAVKADNSTIRDMLKGLGFRIDE